MELFIAYLFGYVIGRVVSHIVYKRRIDKALEHLTEAARQQKLDQLMGRSNVKTNREVP